MDDKFRDVKADFELLTRRFRDGGISRREYVEGLKHLRFRDDEGRFWMIGTQTGKWYYYDGAGWVQSSPPSLGERKAICIYCGYENDLESAVCSGCGGRFGSEDADACPACGSPRDPETGACPKCSSREIPATAALSEGAMSPSMPDEELVIRSFNPLSFLVFWGGLGLVAGVLSGLTAGATSFVPGVSELLPAFFKEMQGKLVGGVVFAALGGIAGFVLFGAVGFILALLANAILPFTGGLKMRIAKPSGKGPGSPD